MLRLALAVLLLTGCDGESFLQCPSPFALMQTESECFDARPALDIVWAAGIAVDPSTVHLTVRDVYTWEQSGAGAVEGWTDQFNVTIARGGATLTHELLHVSERPQLTNHEGWHTNGFYALVNLESFVVDGADEADAWGYSQHPCEPPLLPAEMAEKLRASGYPVDAFQANAARACK